MLAGTSWLDRGLIPTLGQQRLALRASAFCASARLAWQLGGGVGPAVDLSTYAGDPERFERFYVRDALDTPVRF